MGLVTETDLFFPLPDEPIVLSDSEEEEVVILEPQEVPNKTR